PPRLVVGDVDRELVAHGRTRINSLLDVRASCSCVTVCRPVMAITKCWIWLPLVNSFTGTARVLSHCGRTGRLDGPFASLMETIMSKSNDTSKLRIEYAEAFTLDLNSVTTFTVRELRDDELQKVSGGINAKYTLFLESGTPC